MIAMTLAKIGRSMKNFDMSTDFYGLNIEKASDRFPGTSISTFFPIEGEEVQVKCNDYVFVLMFCRRA